MYRIYRLLLFIVFIPQLLHCAALDKKTKIPRLLIQQHTYPHYPHFEEQCSHLSVSPNEKYYLTVGYEAKKNKSYVRLHKADDGSTQKIMDVACAYVLEYESRVNNITWATDSSRFCVNTDNWGEDIRIPSSLESTGATQHSQDDEKTYYYTSTQNTPQGPAHVTFQSIPYSGQLKTCDTYFPNEGGKAQPIQQSRLLNNDTLIAIYVPRTQSVYITDNPHMEDSQELALEPIHPIQNVTAADLLNKLPIIGRLNGDVNILDLNSGKIIETTSVSSQAITGVAQAHDRIAALFAQRYITIVSRATGKKIAEYHHSGPWQPQLMRLNATGDILVYNAGKSLFTIDLKTVVALCAIHLDDNPHTLFFGETGLFVGTPQSITQYSATNSSASSKAIPSQEGLKTVPSQQSAIYALFSESENKHALQLQKVLFNEKKQFQCTKLPHAPLAKSLAFTLAVRHTCRSAEIDREGVMLYASDNEGHNNIHLLDPNTLNLFKVGNRRNSGQYYIKNPTRPIARLNIDDNVALAWKSSTV